MKKLPAWFYEIVVLLGVCIYLSYLHWLKIDRFQCDAGLWLLQASRLASGELLYRDFAWIYLPLPLFVFSLLFQWMGATFLVANIGIVLFSLTAAALFYLVARKVAGDRLAWALTLAFCAGESKLWNLFNMRLYSPAMLIGMNGTLLLTLGALYWVDSQQTRRRSAILIVSGCFICLTSKIEFVPGVVGCLLALAAVAWVSKPVLSLPVWLRQHSALFIGAVLPASVFYFWLARHVGFGDLWQGLQGYGLATSACPWWPHGFGMLSLFTGAGEAVLILAVLWAVRSCIYRSILTPISERDARKRNLLCVIAAIGGFSAFLTYLYLTRENVTFIYQEGPMVWRFIRYAARLHVAILTFVCLGVITLPCLAALLVRDARRGVPWNREWQQLFVLLVSASAMEVRGIFGDWDSAIPTTSQASEPQWFLIAVVAIRLALSVRLSRKDDAIPLTPLVDRVLLIGGACSGTLFLLIYSVAELRQPFQTLSTRAGEVRIIDNPTAAKLYQFVADRLPEGSSFLELPESGGLTFAARLKRPVYREEELPLPMPASYLERDLEALTRNPPRLVVGPSMPELGMDCCSDFVHMSCAFPRIVWKPKPVYYPQGFRFPITVYLEKHYRQIAVIDEGIAVLAPR